MRLDKITIKTREALVAAQDQASRRGHSEISPEHILLALLTQEGGTATPILRKLGADPARIQSDVERALDKQPSASGHIDVGLGRRTRDLVERAEKSAESFKDEYTSTEHLL